MKYLKKYRLFESVNEEEIHAICKEYVIKNYTINSDGTIDVDGDVDLINRYLTKLPLKFNHVSGSFLCYGNQLTSLEGAPQSVGDYFNCNENQLTSLEGAPQSVGDYFSCYKNKLKTLEGAPKSVGGVFWSHRNQLTSLRGLEFKSFDSINLENNPIYEIVKDWINNDNREELIEYFVDMGIIQEGGDKPKLIMMRLEAFHEDIGLKIRNITPNYLFFADNHIDFNEVKKYYEIVN